MKTTVIVVSALNCLVQVLSYILPLNVKKSSVVQTLPMALMSLPGANEFCRAAKDNHDNQTTGSKFVFPFT
ncbi:MAG: hypothetical protein GYA41_11385 [Bacteroidales bacterium]|nr:hypothetical protein [Bacteroidales bacterium]